MDHLKAGLYQPIFEWLCAEVVPIMDAKVLPIPDPLLLSFEIE